MSNPKYETTPQVVKVSDEAAAVKILTEYGVPGYLISQKLKGVDRTEANNLYEALRKGDEEALLAVSIALGIDLLPLTGYVNTIPLTAALAFYSEKYQPTIQEVEAAKRAQVVEKKRSTKEIQAIRKATASAGREFIV